MPQTYIVQVQEITAGPPPVGIMPPIYGGLPTLPNPQPPTWGGGGGGYYPPQVWPQPPGGGGSPPVFPQPPIYYPPGPSQGPGFPTHPISPGGPPPWVSHPIPPTVWPSPPGGGSSPPGYWGGGNVPMPTPPIYLPPGYTLPPVIDNTLPPEGGWALPPRVDNTLPGQPPGPSQGGPFPGQLPDPGGRPEPH